MPATFTPIDRAALDSFRQGDEQALEQIFRREYDALVVLATEESGEPHVAPRIVEGAFAEAWEGRDRFASSAGLEAFLRQAVHQRAVREKTRHAAAERIRQHNATKGAVANGHNHTAAPASADEAWHQLHAVLHPPQVDGAQAARMRAAVARHDAAAHMTVIAQKRSWVIPVAVGVVVAAILLGIGWWLKTAGAVREVERAFAGGELRELMTNPGERAKVTLLDNTEVQLAADSRLSVPATFDRIRAVKLGGGAAEFVVAPGNPIPFTVLAGKAKIVVTGTTFDVSRFPVDSVVTVRVREGTVEVRVGETVKALAANQALQIAADGAMSAPSTDAVDEAFSWLDGQFTMANRPVRDVLPMLDRWYRLSIKVGDSSALGHQATVRAALDAPRSALTALETSGGVVVQWEDKDLVLRDSATTKAQAKKP